jgi:glycosyltransferase involved in cell wall biosynthesis
VLPPRSSDRIGARCHLYSVWHERQDEAKASAPPYPSDRFSGRGIVVCAGGARLFTCAWVLLRVLRELLKSTLPVQVWHLGPQEMDWRMSGLLGELGVEVVDAWRVGDPEERPARGWTLKPFAMLHSPFREVLLLDADNVPVVNPEGLFKEPQFRETGVVFWPDLEPLPPDSPIWEICRVPYREEPSFESGQVLIDKKLCWNALQLTMHLNRHASFYYQHLYGDKDTFHMAWRMLGQAYSMIPYPVKCLSAEPGPVYEYRGPVMQQHDFEGRVIFQHRNFPKWILLGENPRYPGFQYEHECLDFLRELAGRWKGRVSTGLLQPPQGSQSDQSLWFRYERVSSDERMLEFLPDGRIGHGNDLNERRWQLLEHGGAKVLDIFGDRLRTCRLKQDPSGIWRGHWHHYEQMPAELTHWRRPSVPRVTVFGPFRGPTGYDHHVREFARELDRREVQIRMLGLNGWSPARLPERLSWFEERNGRQVEGTVLQFCLPTQVIHWPSSPTINYTMFEANRAPAEWVARSKDHELVILPTESSRQAWIAGGMPPGRIRLCPLGIDPVLYGVAIPPRKLPGRQHRTRFLNVSAYGPRKNLGGLLRAWKRATNRGDDAILLLKVGCYESNSKEALKRDLEGMEAAAPIQILHDLLSDADMPGLYAAATHYISLSHGEGWDLPMMEAAASGLKLIAPRHSAYLAYLDDSVATLLPSLEVPVEWTGDAATGELFRGANWWDPDEEAAVAAIRAAIDGRDGEKVSARERILTEFTWQKATECLLEILRVSGLETNEKQRWFSWWPRQNRSDRPG